MHFTSEQNLDEDVVERQFLLGEVPGILWMPTSATKSAPAPIILMG